MNDAKALLLLKHLSKAATKVRKVNTLKDQVSAFELAVYKSKLTEDEKAILLKQVANIRGKLNVSTH